MCFGTGEKEKKVEDGERSQGRDSRQAKLSQYVWRCRAEMKKHRHTPSLPVLVLREVKCRFDVCVCVSMCIFCVLS